MVWAGCSDPPNAGVDWTTCDKTRLVLRGANLAGARLADADMNGTDLQRANLSGADLTHASVDRARLSGADLSRAKLVQLNGYRSNMTGAILVGADLARANFSKASLQGTRMLQARTFRTRFEGVDLGPVVGLTQSQLDMACGDATTRLPAGLKAPKSWPCGKDD